MQLNNIKCIIFDLGVVIVDVNPLRSVEKFKEFGVNDIEHFYSLSSQEIFIDNFEKGLISVEMFRNLMNERFNAHLSDSQIDNGWNAMLLGFPQNRIDLLQSLSKNHRLFLLSNTNELHTRRLFEMRNRNYGSENLIEAFEMEYYSFKLGLRKPDPQIFDIIFEENGLNVKDTLFVDDAKINIDAANKVGMQTIHVKAEQDITDIFS